MKQRKRILYCITITIFHGNNKPHTHGLLRIEITQRFNARVLSPSQELMAEEVIENYLVILKL